VGFSPYLGAARAVSMVCMNKESEVDPDGVLVTGLTKSYGAVRAVRGIDLAIEPGETVALLGPNGAGKTTAISQISGERDGAEPMEVNR